MPGFARVLQTVADAYRNRRNEVEKATEQIGAVLSSETRTAQGEPLSPDILKQACLALKRDFDGINGGFGMAPKFPQPMTLEFLLRYFHRTGDEEALGMVDLTLEKMATDEAPNPKPGMMAKKLGWL
jgi:hypothetical protein